jgi:hypothetical protein
MSIKSKVFAGAAALSVMAGGLGVAGAATAHASTVPCHKGCVEVSNGGAVLDVYKATAAKGQKIIMWGASNYDKATDFTVRAQGTINQFYKAGLASAALNLHYGHELAVEIEYSPYGVPSGYCVGTANGNGAVASLRPCGVSSKTLWAIDRTHSGTVLVNGASTNFSDPNVLTNRGGVVYDSQLKEFAGSRPFHGGPVQENQIWTYSTGVQ